MSCRGTTGPKPKFFYFKFLVNSMKTKLLIFTFAALLIFAAGDKVMAQSFAVKANIGTLGAGGELSMSVHEKINVRAGANFFSYSYFYETDADDDYDLDAGLNLSNYSAMVDWHPFGNRFRLTGGLVFNGNTVTAEMQPKQSYEIGGDVYAPDELGNLEAEISFSPITPYLGLGFGNALRGSSFGVNFELGAMFQGSPSVTMKADGLLAPSASQAPTLENNLSWFTAYPVMTISLYYRIN